MDLPRCCVMRTEGAGAAVISPKYCGENLKKGQLLLAPGYCQLPTWEFHSRRTLLARARSSERKISRFIIGTDVIREYARTYRIALRMYPPVVTSAAPQIPNRGITIIPHTSPLPSAI